MKRKMRKVSKRVEEEEVGREQLGRGRDNIADFLSLDG